MMGVHQEEPLVNNLGDEGSGCGRDPLAEAWLCGVPGGVPVDVLGARQELDIKLSGVGLENMGAMDKSELQVDKTD
jgi:hypothetical protein